MAVDLNVICNFDITVRGVPFSGKQSLGSEDDAATDPFVISVDGKPHQMATALANSTAVKVWDDDTHQPTDFDFAFFVADVDMTIQLVGSATNVSLQCLAGVPFILSYDKILAAANTTDISGTEPTWEDIDHIVVQNNSGGSGNYFFFCVD